MPAGDGPPLDRWMDAFFSGKVRGETLSSPEASERARRAAAAMEASQRVLLRVAAAPEARFEREVHHHGALLFHAWEGLRHGILSLLLAVHGNYSAADMMTRASLEIVLSGACLDRLVRVGEEGRAEGLTESFDRVVRALREAAARDGPPLAAIRADSGLAVPFVGEVWEREIRFNELLDQLDAFGLLEPLGPRELREYVGYNELSAAAHAVPTRTELYQRIVHGQGAPFDFEPEFVAAAAKGSLDRLHRCVDAGLLVGLNDLEGCLFLRPEPVAALRAVKAELLGDPALLPQAQAVAQRILDRHADPEAEGEMA